MSKNQFLKNFIDDQIILTINSRNNKKNYNADGIITSSKITYFDIISKDMDLNDGNN